MGDALIADFTKRFPAIAIHARLSLSARNGSITVFFGPSGCGKTTVFRSLAGLETPDEGMIQFGGETWFDASRRICHTPQERGIGFVFQDYALFPHLTVAGNIAYSLHALSARDRQKRVHELLERFDLTAQAEQRPRELSGGQQQRVALARALASRPKLLLLDEPLSALDLVLRVQLRGELRHSLSACGLPVLLITHDRAEALALGDELVVMSNGVVAQCGPVLEVFNHPANADVARITGVETLQSGQITKLEEGIATVQVGSARILALASPGAVREVIVCIRGEDVIIQADAAEVSSVRNRLRAHVVAVRPDSPLTRVELDAGFPLFAFITRSAAEDLNLCPGDSVIALVKASAVHLIPR